MPLARRDERELALQTWVSYLSLPVVMPLFVGLFRVAGSYRHPALKELRARVAAEVEAGGDGPLLICPNHLTMIDSMLLVWLLFDWRRYMKGPRHLPWHAPEFANFARTIPLRVMCYVGRCLFVRRGGDRAENRRIMSQFARLLQGGATVIMFPEGTRSRTGRVEADHVTYGVGQLYTQVPGCKVLCVYLRGEQQKTFGYLPRRGETFHVTIERFVPPAVGTDRRGARDIAYAINQTLRNMEARYFADHDEAAAELKPPANAPHSPPHIRHDA